MTKYPTWFRALLMTLTIGVMGVVLWAQQPVTITSGTITLPSGASTAANQATVISSLSTISGDTTAIQAAVEIIDNAYAESATDYATVRLTDGSAFLTIGGDWITGATTSTTTGPGTFLIYQDFDGAALATPSGVDTELEAVPASGSIKGVQYTMWVTEDGAGAFGTSTTPVVVNLGADNDVTVTGSVTANAGTNLNTSTLLTTTAHDAVFGTAGTADSQVMSVQGIASMTPLLVTATQAGTWNVTNISGTISLPTGAATETTLAGVQTVTNFNAVFGSAGTADTQVMSIQGIASMTPILATVTGTVTANAGTNLNTSALLTATNFSDAFGTAGTPDSQVMSIQGITSGTAVLGRTADPCSGAKISVPINQTTGTQLFTGTASNRIYVCHISIVTATAQNVALVSGTGSVCATSIGPMMGGTTAATGWNFVANTGISVGNGEGMVGKTDTDAENVCLLQSSTGQISGVITYVVAVN